MDYSVWMALEDFIPVLLSAAGLSWIVQMIAFMDDRYRTMAGMGVALVTAGGLLKASWKLIYAMTAGTTDIVWMNNSLFWLVTSGFILFTVALYNAQRRQSDKARSMMAIWGVPLGLLVLVIGGGLYLALTGDAPQGDSKPLWFIYFIGMATLFNTGLLVMVIREAWRQELMLVAALVTVNLVGFFLLNGMASAPFMAQPAAQWTAQIIQTVLQAILLYSGWQLARRVGAGDAVAVGEVIELEVARA